MDRSSCFYRWLTLVSLLAFAATQVHASRRQTKLVPKFGNLPVFCPDKKHYGITHNVSIFMDRYGGEAVYADFTLLKGVKILTKISIDIHRCTLGVTNGCEFFSTWSWSAGVCQLMVAKGTLWFPGINSVEPTFKCPLKKEGRYVLHNGSLDLDQLDLLLSRANLDASKYNWIIEVQAFDEDRVLNICFKFLLSLRRVLIRPEGLKNSSR